MGTFYLSPTHRGSHDRGQAQPSVCIVPGTAGPSGKSIGLHAVDVHVLIPSVLTNVMVSST